MCYGLSEKKNPTFSVWHDVSLSNPSVFIRLFQNPNALFCEMSLCWCLLSYDLFFIQTDNRQVTGRKWMDEKQTDWQTHRWHPAGQTNRWQTQIDKHIDKQMIDKQTAQTDMTYIWQTCRQTPYVRHTYDIHMTGRWQMTFSQKVASLGEI